MHVHVHAHNTHTRPLKRTSCELTQIKVEAESGNRCDTSGGKEANPGEIQQPFNKTD